MPDETLDATPRLIRPGACTWCGHRPHTTACRQKIRVTVKGATGPCPCVRHTLRSTADAGLDVQWDPTALRLQDT